MQTYQKDFIQLALNYQALQFGTFTLKSGRISPYFFNAGIFHTGEALKCLANSYAQAIQAAGLSFDVLFGPAYKGIPLACATAMALSTSHSPVPFAYNRKEAKTHGEGGNVIGASLNQRVIIIDDVITAGTAIREAVEIIQRANGILSGIVVALDRQEKGMHEQSAIQEISTQYNIPVVSIVRLEDIMAYVKDSADFKTYYTSLQDYREQYGI